MSKLRKIRGLSDLTKVQGDNFQEWIKAMQDEYQDATYREIIETFNDLSSKKQKLVLNNRWWRELKDGSGFVRIKRNLF